MLFVWHERSMHAHHHDSFFFITGVEYCVAGSRGQPYAQMKGLVVRLVYFYGEIYIWKEVRFRCVTINAVNGIKEAFISAQDS